MLCLFGEFLSCDLWPLWPVSAESGECRGSDVCRASGWLDGCNQCHCEGEDGSTSVALPQVPMPGSQAPRREPGELVAWSSSVSWELWLVWRNTLCCPVPWPWHATTVSDVSLGAFEKFRVMLPHQCHQKEMLYVCNHYNFFITFWHEKNPKRDLRKPGVSQPPWLPGREGLTAAGPCACCCL